LELGINWSRSLAPTQCHDKALPEVLFTFQDSNSRGEEPLFVPTLRQTFLYKPEYTRRWKHMGTRVADWNEAVEPKGNMQSRQSLHSGSGTKRSLYTKECGSHAEL
jgi:hypothetical protein